VGAAAGGLARAALDREAGLAPDAGVPRRGRRRRGGGARAPAGARRAPAPEPVALLHRGRGLWPGIGGDRAALTALARSVAAGARRAGAPPPDEGRRFRPHLTLARCREPTGIADLVGALTGYEGAPWTATQIHLIRSHLGGAAPEYETRGTWPLRPAGDGA